MVNKTKPSLRTAKGDEKTIAWYALPVAEAIHKLKTNIEDGLTPKEA
ncbi:MAG: hypothetical protein OEV35_01340 [Gallionellaceae bacterium]|nr:hypothetical protein [Gallionellaceae bacterium]